MDWNTYRQKQIKFNTYYAKKRNEYAKRRDTSLNIARSYKREAQNNYDRKRYAEAAYSDRIARRHTEAAKYYDKMRAKYAKILYDREEKFPFHVPVPPWATDVIPPYTWPPSKEDLYNDFHKKYY